MEEKDQNNNNYQFKEELSWTMEKHYENKLENEFFSWAKIKHYEKILTEDSLENVLSNAMKNGKVNLEGLENAGYGHLFEDYAQLSEGSVIKEAEENQNISYDGLREYQKKVSGKTIESIILPLAIKEGRIDERTLSRAGYSTQNIINLEGTVEDYKKVEEEGPGFIDNIMNWLRESKVPRLVQGVAVLGLAIGSYAATKAGLAKIFPNHINSHAGSAAYADELSNNGFIPDIDQAYASGINAFEQDNHEASIDFFNKAVNSGKLNSDQLEQVEKSLRISEKIVELNKTYATDSNGQETGKFFVEDGQVKYNTGDNVTPSEYLWSFAKKVGGVLGLKLDHEQVRSDSRIGKLLADKNYTYTVCDLDEVLNGELSDAVKNTAPKKAPVAPTSAAEKDLNLDMIAERMTKSEKSYRIKQLVEKARRSLLGETYREQEAAKSLSASVESMINKSLEQYQQIFKGFGEVKYDEGQEEFYIDLEGRSIIEKVALADKMKEMYGTEKISVLKDATDGRVSLDDLIPNVVKVGIDVQDGMGKLQDRVGTKGNKGTYPTRYALPEQFVKMTEKAKDFMGPLISPEVMKMVNNGFVSEQVYDGMIKGANDAADSMTTHIDNMALDHVKKVFEDKIGKTKDQGIVPMLRELGDRGFRNGFDFNIPGQTERKMIDDIKRQSTLKGKLKKMDKLLHQLDIHRNSKIAMDILQSIFGASMNHGTNGGTKKGIFGWQGPGGVGTQ